MDLTSNPMRLLKISIEFRQGFNGFVKDSIRFFSKLQVFDGFPSGYPVPMVFLGTPDVSSGVFLVRTSEYLWCTPGMLLESSMDFFKICWNSLGVPCIFLRFSRAPTAFFDILSFVAPGFFVHPDKSNASQLL